MKYPVNVPETVEQKVADFHQLIRSGLINRDGAFFPSVHYPPITMYPPVSEEKLFDGYRLPEDGFFELYLHVPFCINQCLFCHYPVQTGVSDEDKGRYLDTLIAEMDLYRARLGLDRFKARSVLLAGGTPTHLTPEHLAGLLQRFHARVDMSGCSQFSVDLDPPTMLGIQGEERLRIMKDLGIDRLTVGAQALDDRMLRRLNRPHTVMDMKRALDRAMQFGFKVNVEFIFGLPWQTLEQWVREMHEIVKLGTDEIQLYRLKIAPYGDRRGPVEMLYAQQPDLFPEVDEAIRMKAMAHHILENAGYRENLGRVFTRTREDYSHYAHNGCCALFDQLGFGLTAYSSLKDRFGLNTLDPATYRDQISRGRLPVDRGMIRDEDAQCRWAFILPLKNRKVMKALFRERTGHDAVEVFGDRIALFIDYGLMVENEDSVALTPRGRFFADEICLHFLSNPYQPYPRSTYANGPLNPFEFEAERRAQAV